MVEFTQILKQSLINGKRWLVESFFSVFKRWFGEYVSHMKIENIRKEVMFKVWIINLFLGLGS